MYKKIVSIDFDGVIHSYNSKWQGPRNIPDDPVNGMIEWIELFINTHCTIPDSICAMSNEGDYELAIFSSRSRYFGGRRAIKKWLIKHGLKREYLEVIKFPLWKPPSHVHIDDRCILFNGNPINMNEVVGFKPWWKNK